MAIRPDAETPNHRSLLARAWGRVPVVVRAIVVGLLVLVGGNFVPQGLLVANVKLLPGVPWSVVLIALYLWLYWQYIRGGGWPRSTAATRQNDLRASALSPQVWSWSLATGVLGIAALTTLTYAIARFMPLGLEFPDVLMQLPPATLVCLVIAVSITAGICEEAAFRGYMQSRIERRHGPAAAIVIVSIVFALAHFPTSMAAVPRMLLIVLASVGYGILAHAVGSILPGLVLHAVGDIVGFALLWLSIRARAGVPTQPPAGWGDTMIWVNALQTLVLGAATIWAFRRLVRIQAAAPKPTNS